ncbi:MAG: SOS response-associated peptidase family protein [Bacilli bacterium]
MCRHYQFDNRDRERLEVFPGLFLKMTKSREILPGEKAPAILLSDGREKLALLSFGIFLTSDPVVNARVETVKEKKLFSDSFQKRRAVLVATSLFERDRKGTESQFYSPKEEFLYLSGFYDEQENFVLLTRKTEKKEGDLPPRLPLLLWKEEVSSYLKEGEIEKILLIDRPPLIPALSPLPLF